MERFIGKVAVVTGASGGIGAAIAEKLVSEGMKVVGLARRIEKLEQMSEQWRDKTGKLYAVKTDVSKEEDIKNALKWIATNLGPIHVLVNNAGLIKQADFLTLTNDDIKTTFDINVIALTILSRDVANSMVQNKIDGHIINMNALAGHTVLSFPGVNVYCGTKYAITALTETLRKELARQGSKIRVSSISPGYVVTDFQDSMDPDLRKEMTKYPSLKAEDIADAVAYSISAPPHVNITEMIIQPTGELF